MPAGALESQCGRKGLSWFWCPGWAAPAACQPHQHQAPCSVGGFSSVQPLQRDSQPLPGVSSFPQLSLGGLAADGLQRDISPSKPPPPPQVPWVQRWPQSLSHSHALSEEVWTSALGWRQGRGSLPWVLLGWRLLLYLLTRLSSRSLHIVLPSLTTPNPLITISLLNVARSRRCEFHSRSSLRGCPGQPAPRDAAMKEPWSPSQGAHHLGVGGHAPGPDADALGSSRAGSAGRQVRRPIHTPRWRECGGPLGGVQGKPLEERVFALRRRELQEQRGQGEGRSRCRNSWCKGRGVSIDLAFLCNGKKTRPSRTRGGSGGKGGLSRGLGQTTCDPAGAWDPI